MTTFLALLRYVKLGGTASPLELSSSGQRMEAPVILLQGGACNRHLVPPQRGDCNRRAI